MGFKNNPAYVQKQIDGFLKILKFFVKTCINDFVNFNQTLENHVQHFNHVFNFLDEWNIVLKPSKSYIGYPSVTFLGQRIEQFRIKHRRRQI